MEDMALNEIRILAKDQHGDGLKICKLVVKDWQDKGIKIVKIVVDFKWYLLGRVAMFID